MKNAIAFFTICICLIAGNGNAKEKPQSLLWKITGKGLTTPSYLFGTIHMICEDNYLFREKVTRAFDESEKLYFEINYDDPAEIAEMQKGMTSTGSWTNNLSPEKKARLEDALKKYYGMTIQQADKLSPSMMISYLSYKSVGCTKFRSYEMELSKLAKSRNKPMGGLEKVAAQMDAIRQSYTPDDLVSQLSLTPEYTSLIAEAQKAYKAEELDKVGELLNDSRFMNPEIRKVSLDGRNQNWADRIPALMQQNTSFFAVGAAHLSGKKGLIQLLRKKGYTVTPVLE
ncbi:TraB/GumN family protein [Siphonobacter aquaeclarae]|uniref:TraB family protein n=1 Tax=Siphonobacter aquaeclarae TaxID=563176 RepID=A0A1G9XQZ8_9BACT|nr:TraB/GumN family protein [Siphonobacter aquaeclarae]SDM99217.1 hypothetical protein SAMN04488090_4721 [Siphonobacter aquaeclarae]